MASSRPCTAVRTANPLSASNWGGGAAELLNQQQSRPANARILCNVLTRLQAAAAASDLLGNELSISRRSLELYRPTRKPGNPVTVQYLFFFFFLPIFTDPPRFLLTLRLGGGVLSTWAASCHCPPHLSARGSFFTASSSLPKRQLRRRGAPSGHPQHRWNEMFCSHFPASLPLFLSPRTLFRLCFSLPPHKLLISALSSISAANKRPVSCTSLTSAPAPDRVSASHHAEAFCYFHHRASCSTPRLQT